MQDTIDKFFKKLTTSLNRSALLNVAPTKKTVARLDLSSFNLPAMDDPIEIISKVLFEDPYETRLDFDSHEWDDPKMREEATRLYAVLRQGVEKRARFVLRETGLRSIWLLYPLVYLRTDDEANNKTTDVLAPLYLWPINLSTSGQGFRKVLIKRDQDADEPVFNQALSMWIQQYMGVTVDDQNCRELWEADRNVLQDRVSELLNPLGLSSRWSAATPLEKLPLKTRFRNRQSRILVHSAVLGILQWSNQELMEDLRKLRKVAENTPGSLKDTLVEGFLQGTPIPVSPKVEQSQPPPEEDRYLVFESDFSQEKVIWKAREKPGLVVHGPPGTGKSQTIANLVVDALIRNERVLLVCQKRAALDVVASRLDGAGLNDCYMLVHDVKSDRLRTIMKIRKVLEDSAAALPGTSLDEVKLLSDRIKKTEKTLDSYFSALVNKHDRIGLSYKDVITRMRSLMEKTPGIKPIPELQDRLRDIIWTDFESIKEMLSQAASLWTEGVLLNNPWRYLRNGVDLDPFVLEDIDNLLHRVYQQDQQHTRFVNRSSSGCMIEGDIREFIADGNRLVGYFHGKSSVDVVDHLVEWGRLGITGDPAGSERIRKKMRKALELVSQLEQHPVDPVTDGKLDVIPNDEMEDLRGFIRDISYYKDKWWRSMSGRFAKMEARLRSHLKKLAPVGVKFPFYLLQPLDDHLRAKLALSRLRSLLVEVFEHQSRGLLDRPMERLKKVLEEKDRAMAALEALHKHRKKYGWAEEMLAAIESGDAQSLRGKVLSLTAAVSRAKEFETFFDDLRRFREWLEKDFTDSVETRARAGRSVGHSISALQSYRPKIETVVALRNLKSNEEGISIDLLSHLERRFEKDASDRAPTESRFHPRHWVSLCLVAAYKNWENEIKKDFSPLRKHNSQWYDAAKKKLQDQLDQKRNKVVPAAKELLAKKRVQAAAHDDWKLLLAKAGKAAKRLREVIMLGGQSGLFDLIPCWMTTPNMVSCLFPLTPDYFDLVIFDEASQCPLEQAIPSIYRGSKVLVAGDEKQLPPTSFFHAVLDWPETEAENDERLDEVEEIEDDAARENKMKELGKELALGVEDLLEAAKVVLPEETLQVHYRSQYPELVEFSNHAFYKGKLHVPPSTGRLTGGGRPPIAFHHVPEGRLKDKTNEEEADKVVSLLYDLMKEKGMTPSVGIVTFNQPQAVLIERKLDECAEKDEEFRVLYEKQLQLKDGEQDVGLFVKNLESVQGDERDVMVFSTTFARNEDGVFRRLFGPINLSGGERRLNVAVTRAKQGKIVVTSMPLNEIAPEVFDSQPGTAYSGRHYLQLYLKYAKAVSEGTEDVVRDVLDRARKIGAGGGSPNGGNGIPESPFEEEVDAKLRLALKKNKWTGLEVCPQVGSLGFRIDLAIRDTGTGAYLLGIECDGRIFHESHSARVRDVWRQRILENYGWKIHRIWSTNWWTQPDREIHKIMEILEPLVPRS